MAASCLVLLAALALAPSAAWAQVVSDDGSVSIMSATLPQAPISALVLSFFFFSFCGWVWESTFCGLMNQGRFTNSGFLLGPLCPIYGVGCLLCWILFREIESPALLFFVSGVSCSALEYVVGVGLESMTGARFWNYDDKPLNIHGRVCLYSFLMFGFGSIFICRIAQPWWLGVLAPYSGVVLFAVAMVLCVVLAVDVVFAVASWRRMSSRLEELRCQLALRLDDSLGEASERMIEHLPDAAVDVTREVYERTREASSEALERVQEASSGLAERTREASSELAERAAQAREERLAQAREASGEAGRELEPEPEPTPEPVRVAELGPQPKLVPSLSDRIGANSPSPEPPAWLVDATEQLVAKLGRRDLRFFNAFPQLRIPRYEGVIARARLRERIGRLFGR